MTEANRIKVMLVDDQNMIRQGFGYILSLQPDLQIVGEAGNGNDAVKMAEELRPDVILMDVQMPFMDGIEATKRIMAQQTGVKIVILTTFDDQDYVLEGIRAGAVGYLLKDAEASDMIEAIRAAYRGEAIYKTKLASGALQEAIASASLSAPDNVLQVKLLEPLTEREQEILQEMAYGLRNEQIAAKLFITEGTVKSHVHRILQKFGCEDRTQVVVMALRGGLVK
ncbi:MULTISPECIES: response regulator [Paenibacillus]|jgi:DNA-binding NarL/FixJ family response regulator|uniref:response regulator n=1 Tax=Paenibacillus TaxID=44249 RepID=UPI00048A6CD7|nr:MULTISPECIES: response regulator transcription factor [Paenibacillus]MDU0330349.1 response regulator transcription factor [Paenibacillus sp. 3LSP]MEC2343911.1 response regulator transcription factor [Paenibacillus barengoltzii]